jgi:hypothetical protein
MYAIGGVEASYAGEIFTVGGWARRASLPDSFSLLLIASNGIPPLRFGSFS